VYDVAVIGAGINGASIAYELTQAGKRVLVLEREAVAAGGSGAAGAFISPKFSKAGELKALIEEAFLYSLYFYSKNFPEAFHSAKLLHIAKDEKDDALLQAFKEKTTLPLLEVTDAELSSLTQAARAREHISLQAGVVDAKAVCESMLVGVDVVFEALEHFSKEDGFWKLNDAHRAKEIVFATGAYEPVYEEPYIELRGVWGHRIDVLGSRRSDLSIHQFVSISPSSDDGSFAIGATHNVHYHPQKTKEPYDIEAGRAELLEKAERTLDVGDVKIVKDYMGLRSGSFDYLPIIGALVDTKRSIEKGTKAYRVKKQDYAKFSYHEGLYMINGSGGYGFVLAPLLAKMLREHMLQKQPIAKQLTPARFFGRWVKRYAPL
jgi:tRNA 5-methylaminomethyl-2-thiouridine biosynthesis bifunctional protein